ncbi:hypothetical protein LTR08_003838 [Meristemomyces frigidus]|nr:hypothetical protein LTR08_003838 [Meristemomyces frigidus]
MHPHGLLCCSNLAACYKLESSDFIDYFSAFIDTAQKPGGRFDVSNRDVAVIAPTRYADNMTALNNRFDAMGDEDRPKAKYAIVLQEQLTVGPVSRFRKSFFLVYKPEDVVQILEVPESELSDGGFNAKVDTRQFECKAHQTVYDVVLYKREKKLSKQAIVQRGAGGEA